MKEMIKKYVASVVCTLATSFISSSALAALALAAVFVTSSAWADAVPKTKVLAVNFDSNNGKESDDADSAALDVTMKGKAWCNTNGQNGNAIVSVYDTETQTVLDSTANVSWTGSGVHGGTGVTAEFMRGFIDDTSNGDQTITFTNIPFDQYDVIYYAGTDTGTPYQGQDVKFAPVKFNDTMYTYDANNQVVTTTTWDDAWGISHHAATEYGYNAMRVNGFTSTTLTITRHRKDVSGHHLGRAGACAVVLLGHMVDPSIVNRMYINKLATGNAAVDAGTYGEIVVPEAGIKATAFASNTDFTDAAVAGTWEGTLEINAHTWSAWYKIDALPTSGWKLIYADRTGKEKTGGYLGYAVSVGPNGNLKVGRCNQAQEFNDGVEFSAGIAKDTWYYITVVMSKSGTTITPSVFVNGAAVSTSGSTTTIAAGMNGDSYYKFVLGAGVSAAGLYIDKEAVTDTAKIKSWATIENCVEKIVPIEATLIEGDNVKFADLAEGATSIIPVNVSVLGDATINFTSEGATAKSLTLDGEHHVTLVYDTVVNIPTITCENGATYEVVYTPNDTTHWNTTLTISTGTRVTLRNTGDSAVAWNQAVTINEEAELRTEGDINFAENKVLINGQGALTIASGVVNYRGTGAGGKPRGTITIAKGAKWIVNGDIDTISDGLTLNVYGEFENNGRFTPKNDVTTLNIYAGAVLSGTDNTYGNLDFYNGAYTVNVHPDPDGTSDMASFTTTWRLRDGDATLNVADGVKFNLSGQLGYYSNSSSANKKMIKTGDGTLILSGTGAKHCTGGLTVNAGTLKLDGASHGSGPLSMAAGTTLDLSSLTLTDGAATLLSGNVMLDAGVMLQLPETLNPNTPFTLCGGTLSGDGAKSGEATFYIGDKMKIGMLTFENKAVSYSDAVNCFIVGDGCKVSDINAKFGPGEDVLLVMSKDATITSDATALANLLVQGNYVLTVTGSADFAITMDAGSIATTNFTGALTVTTSTGIAVNAGTSALTYNYNGDEEITPSITCTGAFTKGGSGIVNIPDAMNPASITVAAGVAKFTANSSYGQSKLIKVLAGGQVDCAPNGSKSQWKYELAGFGPDNTGALIVRSNGSYGSCNVGAGAITLTGDASINVPSGKTWFLVSPNNNSNTIELDNHTLSLVGAGTFSLSNTTVQNGTLKVASGTLSKNVIQGQPRSWTFTNATLVLDGGTLNLNADISLEKFTYTSGTISGDSKLTVTGVLTLGDGVTLPAVTLTGSEINVAEGAAAISALTCANGFTKTGAGTLNLPASYTGAVTLREGAINDSFSGTLTIASDFTYAKEKLPLLATLAESGHTGSITLPEGYFGQIAKITGDGKPTDLKIKDFEGNEIAAEKFTKDSNGYLVLKSEEIRTIAEISHPTEFIGDMNFGQGGGVKVLLATPNTPMFYTTSAITVAGGTTAPITLDLYGQYEIGTKFIMLKGASIPAVENFTCALGATPTDTEIAATIEATEDGGQALVFTITASLLSSQTEETKAALAKAVVDFDAGRFETLTKDDIGNVTGWANRSSAEDASTYDATLTGDGRRAGNVSPVFAIENGRAIIDFGDCNSQKDLGYSRVAIKAAIQVVQLKNDKRAFYLGDYNGGNAGGKYSFHRDQSDSNPPLFNTGNAKVFAVHDNGIDRGRGTSGTFPDTLRIISVATESTECYTDCLSTDRDNVNGRSGGRKLCETLLFTEALTDSERVAIETYLNQKWGIYQRFDYSGTVNVSKINDDIASASGKLPVLTVADNTTIVVDVAPSQVMNFSATGAITVEKGTESSATDDDFAYLTFDGATKLVYRDTTYVPSTAPGEGVTYRWEGNQTLAAIPYAGSDSDAVEYNGMVDIACGIVGSMGSVYVYGSKKITFSENAAYTTPSLVLGNKGGVTQTFTQNGGALEFTKTGSGTTTSSAFVLAHYGSTVTYNLVGGMITVPNDNTVLGWDGSATMTIGGESTAALLKTKGIANNSGHNNKDNVLTISPNGTLSLGEYGAGLQSRTQVKLNGGTLEAYETCTFAAANANGIQVTADSTINILENVTLTISAPLTGSGDITKTGAGTLKLLGSLASYEGEITISEGALDIGNVRDFSQMGNVVFSGIGKLVATATPAEYGAGAASFTNLPASLTELKFIVNGVEQTLTVSEGKATYTGPVVVDGYATWLDYTFTKDTREARKESQAYILNAGSAGVNVSLQYDTNYSANNSYNEENGALLAKSTPWRMMSGTSAWPSSYTVAVCANVPDVENCCLIGFGSTTDGNTHRYVTIVRGADSNTMKLMEGNGLNNDATLITEMSALNATVSKHLIVFKNDGTKFYVYCDGVKVTEVGAIALGDGFQVGSVHGGVPGNLTRVSGISDQTVKNAVEIKAVRAWDRLITDAEMDALVAEFPYINKAGLFDRTIDAATANLSEENAWANHETQEKVALPQPKTEDDVTYQPSISVNTTVDSILTLNASLLLDSATFDGEGTLTITAGESENTLTVGGSITVNSPIKIKYGEVNISTTPLKLGEDGALEIDLADCGFDPTVIGRHQLTGVTEETDGKITIKNKPTAQYFKGELVYEDGSYWFKVSADREATTLYLTESAPLSDDTLFAMTEDGKAIMPRLFADDVIYVKTGLTATMPSTALTIKPKFDGVGTIAVNGGTLKNSAPILSVVSTWTGTVEMTNITMAGDSAVATWFDLNAYGNENSKVKLTGAAGYMRNGVTFAPEVILANNTNAGININNGAKDTTLIFRKVSGEGNFIGTGDVKQRIAIDDVSTHTGQVRMEGGKGITLGSTENTAGDAQIAVANGATITFANQEWVASSGVSFGATLNVIGTVGESYITMAAAPTTLPTTVNVVGDESDTQYMLKYADGKLILSYATINVTIPPLENATPTVVADGESITITGNIATIPYGTASLTVTYTAGTGYFFADGSTTKTFNFENVTSAPTIDVSTIPVTLGEAASMTEGEVVTWHQTLAQAFGAQGAVYIMVLKDITLTDPISVTSFSGTLDLGGYTVSGEFADSAVLTIANSCKIDFVTTSEDGSIGKIINNVENGIAIENIGNIEIYNIDIVGDVITASTGNNVNGQTWIEQNFAPTSEVNFDYSVATPDGHPQIGIDTNNTNTNIIIPTETTSHFKIVEVGEKKYLRTVKTVTSGGYAISYVAGMPQIAIVELADPVNVSMSNFEHLYQLGDVRFAYVSSEDDYIIKFLVTPEEGCGDIVVTVNGDDTRATFDGTKYCVEAKSNDVVLTITASASEFVAEVDGTKYTSISEAITAAISASKPITFLKDVSDAIALTGDLTINVPENTTRTLSGVISGSGKLTKTGIGTLVLNAANTFTGGLYINEGIAKAGVVNGLGGNGTGEVHVADGATLDTNGQRLVSTIYLIGDGVDGKGAFINNNADMAGSINTIIHLTGNASWGGTKYFHFGANSDVNLEGFTFTKKGSNTFPLNNTTIHGPGKIVVAEGTFDNQKGSNILDDIDFEVLSGATLGINGTSLSVRDFTCNGTITGNSAILKVNGTIHGGATIPKLELFNGSKIALAQGESITISNNTLTLPEEGKITLDVTGYNTVGDYAVVTGPNNYVWDTDKVTFVGGEGWTMYDDGNLLKVKLLTLDADISNSEGYNYTGFSIDVDVTRIAEGEKAYINLVVRDTDGQSIGEIDRVEITGKGLYQVPVKNLNKGADYTYEVTIVDETGAIIEGSKSDDGKVTLGDVQTSNLFSASAETGESVVVNGSWTANEPIIPTIESESEEEEVEATKANYYQIADDVTSVFTVADTVESGDLVSIDFEIAFDEGFTTEIDQAEDAPQAGVTISAEAESATKYWYVCDGGEWTATTTEAIPGAYTVTMEFDYKTKKVRYSINGIPLTDSSAKVWFDNGAESATKIASVSFKGESQLTKFAASAVTIDTNLAKSDSEKYATVADVVAAINAGKSITLLTNVSVDLEELTKGTRDIVVNGNKFKWSESKDKFITIDKDGKFVVKEITETDKPKNGFSSFDSYVLNLDPEVETSKPYGEAPADNGYLDTLTVKIKGPDGKDLSPRDGYAVKYIAVPKLGEGTKTVISSEPAIDLPLPTSGEVQYSIKIEVIEQ